MELLVESFFLRVQAYHELLDEQRTRTDVLFRRDHRKTMADNDDSLTSQFQPGIINEI